jgi:UDP-GlcNAc:undecaprenyl-phosphate/decaprenyl-phosphate GlcNAc-1-phosphate transferase
MIIPLIIAFVSSIALSLALTPWVMHVAKVVGAIDKPNERKVHSTPTPRLGGVAIFMSVFISLIALLLLDRGLIINTWIVSREGLFLFGSLALVLALGIWDDIRSLRPSQKFLGQLLLSVLMYFAGFSVTKVSSVFGIGFFNVGILDFPMTILWIIGVTNAINLIDGLDGLAAGIALIASMTMLPMALMNGDVGSAVLIFLLAGSLLGFLRYNFNPAKIFLGDSGSLFLGFMLAVLSVKSSTKITTGFALLLPILALGLPIMDTLLSMIRRVLRPASPSPTNGKNRTSKFGLMFQPDKSHIHHKLLSNGLSHRKAVLVLYLVSCGLGLSAFAITVVNNFVASLILLAVGTAVIVGIRRLQYKEMAVLQNGILLPLYDRPIMNRDSFQIFFDLVFILLSYALAFLMVEKVNLIDPIGREFLKRISIVAVVQLAVFIFSGQYKRTYQFFGVGDALVTVRTLIMAVVAMGLATAIFLPPFRPVHFIVLALDTFFLASLVFGTRMSFRALQYLSKKSPVDGKRVIIYGADVNGSLMLERMLESNLSNWIPVGFIDDDPMMEGKYLNGYPVFGGHWKLHKLIREKNINEIVVCSETVQPEVLKRVKRLAKENKIDLKKLRILYEDYHDDKELKPVVPILQVQGRVQTIEIPSMQHEEEVRVRISSQGEGAFAGFVANGVMAKPNF